MVAVSFNGTDILHLMRINVGDRRIREKGRLLLVGSCMMSRYPEIVEEYVNRKGGYAILQVCLEETHVNQAGFKIGSIVRYSNLEEVVALTVDGSPHCVQLHFVIEDIKRHFTPDVETDHYVVERGKVHQISSKAVKRARHLSKIQKMLDKG
jgi:hypothetical protein